MNQTVKDKPLETESELTLPEDYVEYCGSPDHLIQESFHRMNGVENLKAWIYGLWRLRQMYISHDKRAYHRYVQVPTKGHRGRVAAMTPLETCCH